MSAVWRSARPQPGGPNGVALLIDTLTDNKNRTTASVRHALTKHNGNLGEAGCVSWIFETKGVIFVPRETCDEERLIDVALEAGAEDVRDEGDGFDHANLPDPSDSENLYKLNGRGIMVMRFAMDDVRFNGNGNEVMMVREASSEA